MIAFASRRALQDIHEEFTFQPQLRNKTRLMFCDLGRIAKHSGFLITADEGKQRSVREASVLPSLAVPSDSRLMRQVRGCGHTAESAFRKLADGVAAQLGRIYRSY